MAPSTYEEFLSPPPPLSAIPYTPLAAEEEGEEEGRLSPGPKKGITLSASDKWRLVKPLFGRYMLPLCVYPSTASFRGNSPVTCSLRLPCASTAFELYTSCLSHSDAVRVYDQPGYFPYAPLPSAISGKTLAFEQGHSFFARLLSSLAGKVFSFFPPPYHKLCFLIDLFFYPAGLPINGFSLSLIYIPWLASYS